MSDADPLIRFDHVSLRVDGRTFLRQVSLSVQEGETLVVAGLPGCGKSFILRLILGLPGTGLSDSVAVEGQVLAEGESVLDMPAPVLQQWRCRTSSVMRGGGLIENMDVRRNILLPLLYHCRDFMEPAEIDARCDRLLDELGIGELDVRGLRPVSLNREQRVYVSLARALIVEPRVLLMDDPVEGLSPERARRLKSFCLEYSSSASSPGRGPVTRVVTTNDLSRYLDHGNRFAVLSGGCLEDIGDRAAAQTSTDERVQELMTCGPPAGQVAAATAEMAVGRV
ncbi:ATP-binding cassette domain-containing protein [Candidatus Latescibacterota bacterium]